MITLSNIHKQFGSKILFNTISLALNPSHCIGFIGPNGSGKTMLLRILAGKEQVDSGEVVVPSNLRIGYLAQEMSVSQDITPLDLVLKPFAHLLEVDGIIEKLSAVGDHTSPTYQKNLQEYDTLVTELAIHDVHSLEARAKKILTGLGVLEETWHNPIANLSGGFQMRVVLAQLLLRAPDFLLLDEPTNHLDMDSLIWLEKFLQRFKGGMIIVSHDRDFINRLSTHTMEIAHGEITQYSGKIDSYLTWKEEHSATELRRVKNIQDKISQTEQFITRFKAKNTKASQAKSKMKQLERLKEELPPEQQFTQTIHFDFPEPSRSGSVPIKLDAVSVSYEENRVLDNVSLTVTRGDKIAVLGPNGAGKSTLLKTCAEQLYPDSGTVQIGHNTTINYYSQHRLEQLDPEKTLFDTVAQVATQTDKTFIQSILGAFLFSGEECEKRVGVLSGGEKSRLSLATILANPGNMLILDEPTNHLDIASIECLTKALQKFEGTLLIVSHDEYFLSPIANRIIELRPGKLRDFPGNLSDYRSYIEQGFIDSFSEDTTADTLDASQREVQKKERIRKRQESKKVERAIERVERDIHTIEDEISTLESQLHSPEHASNAESLNRIQAELQEKQTSHEHLLVQWEELHEKLSEFK